MQVLSFCLCSSIDCVCPMGVTECVRADDTRFALLLDFKVQQL